MWEYKDFSGTCNSKDLTRIPRTHFRRGENVDIDDSKKLHRRRGKKIIVSTNTHSMWSNQNICLCVQSGTLKKVDIDFNAITATYTTILSGVGDNHMEYQDVGSIIFFTNNSIIGKIENGTASYFSDPDQTFKAVMPAGHLLEYWDSRLYVARNNEIIPSDATMPMVKDTRHNSIPMSSRIRMMKAVADGLYVSDTERCVFLHGGVGDPPKFKYTDIVNAPCIEGMAISVRGEDIGEWKSGVGIMGTVVIWATEKGEFLGLPGGETRRVTKKNFYLEGIQKGRAIFITRTLPDSNAKFSQYLGVYDYKSGYGGMNFALTIPAVEVSSRITTT